MGRPGRVAAATIGPRGIAAVPRGAAAGAKVLPTEVIQMHSTTRSRPARLALLVAAILFAALLATPAAQAADAAARPANVILFIPDGFGPAHGTMARDFRRVHLQAGETLVLDGIEVGSIRTHASDSLITDSAASATAYSTGVKTYNGAIGVDRDGRPLATVLQAARQRGMATGIVTTTRLTHASPASFVAHVPSRSMENEIAGQLLRTRPDLAIGGGARFFLPEDAGGARPDGRNLVEEARAAGYAVARTGGELQAVQQLPVLALLADDHLAYEIDRGPTGQPSLAELTGKALELLSAQEQGFFVMIEAGRIDHGAHANDIAATLHDVLAFDEAMRVALDFVERDGNTLLISVADHETGGLTLGRSIDGRSGYAWHPQVVAGVKASQGPIMAALRARSDEVAAVLQEFTGIDDLSEAEAQSLAAAAGTGRGLAGVLGEIIARRAAIGWTTGGHTAVDVRLHAAGVGSEQLVGNHDNTFVGRIIEQMLGLELDALTQQMRAAGL